jgi:hypothetical protein
MRPAPPRRPGHAGPLPRWERLAFALVFALMILFVVVMSVSAARDHGDPAGTGGSLRAPSGTQPSPAVRNPVEAAGIGQY